METDNVTGEELCVECEVPIQYAIEEGKRVVTCPECGAVNPLCCECSRPELEHGSACDKCELMMKCEELNSIRARSRAQLSTGVSKKQYECDVSLTCVITVEASSIEDANSMAQDFADRCSVIDADGDKNRTWTNIGGNASEV